MKTLTMIRKAIDLIYSNKKVLFITQDTKKVTDLIDEKYTNKNFQNLIIVNLPVDSTEFNYDESKIDVVIIENIDLYETLDFNFFKTKFKNIFSTKSY